MLVESKKSGITFKPRLCELHVIRCQQQYDLEQSSLPNCCIRYPPGSTVLECLFENDRPVARVIQMQSNSIVTSEGMHGEISSKTAKKLKKLAKGQSIKQDKIPPIIIILQKSKKEEESEDEQTEFNGVISQSNVDGIGDSSKEKYSDALENECITTPKANPEKDIQDQSTLGPRSPPHCVPTCLGSKRIQKYSEPVEKLSYSTLKKRNGLEPVDSEVKTCTFTIPKKPKRVCPMYCCKYQQKLETEPSPVPRSSVSALTKKEKKRKSESETKCTEKPELRRSEICFRSKVKRTLPKKRLYDTVSVSSEEVIMNYSHLIPENRLAKYLSCSSKRNGLQDECVLPIPRTVIEAKKAQRYKGELAKATDEREIHKCDSKKGKSERKQSEIHMKKTFQLIAVMLHLEMTN